MILFMFLSDCSSHIIWAAGLAEYLVLALDLISIVIHLSLVFFMFFFNPISIPKQCLFTKNSSDSRQSVGTKASILLLICNIFYGRRWLRAFSLLFFFGDFLSSLYISNHSNILKIKFRPKS